MTTNGQRGKRGRSAAFAAVVLAFASLVFAGGGRAWPPAGSDVEPDPALRVGELENGFRYALLPRDARSGAASLRLVVEVGSLDEGWRERGLAHFVEHMAFEGTRRFGPGELVDFFQRLGMSYGVDVNAFTYHDKTVYHLELPQGEPALLDEALALYRDYADGMLFPEDRIENQRAVILREKLARQSPSALIEEESFAFAFKGSRLSDRDPMGLESAIESASRTQLQRFYEKWYRPDLMTLVAVGDFDAASLEKQIGSAFASMEEPRGEPPKRRMGKLRGGARPRIGSLAASGVDRLRVEVSRAWHEEEREDSWAFRRQETLRDFATSLLNERCRYAIDGFSGDYAFYYRVGGIPYSHLLISSGEGGQSEAVLWIDRRIREALAHGFAPAEIDRQRANWLRRVKTSELRYASAEPREIADELVECIVNDRVFVTAARYSDFVEALLAELEPEQVNAAFAEAWGLDRMAYFVVGPLESPLRDRDLRRLLAEDRERAPPPFPDYLQGDFEYADLGPPGGIVERGEIVEIGAKLYRFENNARLTVLRSDREKGMSRAMARVGGGLLSFTDRNPATHALAMPSLFRSGAGDREVEAVYAELRNRVSSFFVGVEDHDAFSFRALAPADGLESFLRIVAEYLRAPEVKGHAFALAKSKLLQARAIEADGLNEGYRELARMVYPDEPRFHEPSASEIAAADLVVMRDWLERQLRSGYLEVVVVGDVDPEETAALFARTLGALPARDAQKPSYEDARSLELRSEPGSRRIEYESGKGEGASAVVVWTIQEEIERREGAALRIIASILENRIREIARDLMGKTYGPQVAYQSFAAYRKLRHIRADIDCDPADAEALSEEVQRLAADLRERRVGQDELLRATAPLEETLRLAWQDNAFLLENVLFAAHEYPEVAEAALAYRDGLFSQIGPDEIQAAARRFLRPEIALAVSIVPRADDARLAESPSAAIAPPAAIRRR